MKQRRIEGKCLVDKKTIGKIYNNCCLDYGKASDCEIAVRLSKAGKTKLDCEHWKPQDALLDSVVDAAKMPDLSDDIKSLLLDVCVRLSNK
jgi:hypothetical protein